MLESGALLTLDENNQIKIVESTTNKPTRFRNIYGTLNSSETEKDDDLFIENAE
jgi:hypothetical protein